MYQKPGWFTKNVFNKAVELAVALGLKPAGAHVLAVRGRKSGEWRTVPVNPLDLDGQRYLVAPRGVTEWVRNLRASKSGEIRAGSRRHRFTAVELPDDEKPPILREYLERWGSVTAANFGVGKDASDEDLRRIAPAHPVFRITEEA